MRGDTIVEVLVAIAVASAVLSASFVVVNRTFKNARQVQEHEEALKLTEGQVEQFKNYLKLPGNTLPAGSFCFDASGALDSSPPCTVNSVPGGYKLTVEPLASTGSLAGEHLVNAKADWDGPTGGQEHVSVLYKVYQ